jgi:hypothetical protein
VHAAPRRGSGAAVAARPASMTTALTAMAIEAQSAPMTRDARAAPMLTPPAHPTSSLSGTDEP